MTLRGVDISSHQPTVDFGALALEHAFCIIKATGGSGYFNPEYRKQLAGARAAGLVVGHYHFAHEASIFAPPGLGPEAEADHFLSVADVQPGELVALDIEDTAIAGNLAGWALTWLRRVEARLGFKPLLYTFPFYLSSRNLGTEELAAFPLWFASYPNTFDPNRWPPVPGQWQRIAIWQWSGGTTVAGIPNDTDENITTLTRAEMVALGKPSQTPPGGAESVRAYINARGETILEINYGGVADTVLGVNVVDAGVSVAHAGQPYHRSVQANQFQPWLTRSAVRP